MSKLLDPVEAIAIIMIFGAMAMQSGRKPEDVLAGIMYTFAGIIIGIYFNEKGKL